MGTTHRTVSRAAFSDWQQKKDLYVYLQGGSVKLDAYYPPPADNTFRKLLGRLIYRNGAYAVIQEQHGAIIENYHMVLGGL